MIMKSMEKTDAFLHADDEGLIVLIGSLDKKGKIFFTNDSKSIFKIKNCKK